MDNFQVKIISYFTINLRNHKKTEHIYIYRIENENKCIKNYGLNTLKYFQV